MIYSSIVHVFHLFLEINRTGKIFALDFDKVLNKVAKCDISKNLQLDWNMFE